MVLTEMSIVKCCAGIRNGRISGHLGLNNVVENNKLEYKYSFLKASFTSMFEISVSSERLKRTKRRSLENA